jgi:starch synthase
MPAKSSRLMLGMGLNALLRSRRDRLYGVLNGIDGDTYNPANDSHIATQYSLYDIDGKRACKAELQAMLGLQVDVSIPVVSVISRLTNLKGFDLIDEMIDAFLRTHVVQLVVMGTRQTDAITTV